MATYWERRVQMADASLEKSEQAIAKRTYKFYESELADLSREIASYYKRYGKDNVLEYRAMMQLMDALDRDLLIRNVEEFERRYPELKSVVEIRKSIYKLNRLEGLQASAKVHLARATAQAEVPLGTHFAKTAANAANAVAETLGKGKNFHTFDSDAIKQFVGTHWADGKSYSETIWGNTDRLATYVQQDMAKALARGVSYEQMTSELHKRFVDVSEANIMRLVQTEGTYVARTAQAAELQKEGFDSYYINPVGDERTCEVCGDVGKHSHDEIYRFDDAVVGQNFPPLHPRCRCQIAPAVSDWDAWQKQQIDKKRAELVAKRIGTVEEWEPWKDDSARRTVNMSKIRGKTYRANLKVALGKASDAAVADVERMLSHRSGTAFEDMYAYDMSTGKRLGSVVNSKVPKRVEPSVSLKKSINKAVKAGGDVAIVHNHPDSMLPSAADILSLISTGSKRGVICCHDGSIYVFEVVGKPAPGYTVSDSVIRRMVALRSGRSEASIMKAFEDNLGVHVEHLC